ncbi:hypothetical protein B0F90DRAFT_688371 [Multifurca ochricompacta]|uniref:Uncharacterized protein n=1 Tax=Multifurca ochricompacta TaxID=376703 RepID=A0AAD4M2G3_9AGAM|nr:hypothetical protein B0F90DRAFT_688371 [Multifurca ochricompacta]
MMKRTRRACDEAPYRIVCEQIMTNNSPPPPPRSTTRTRLSHIPQSPTTRPTNNHIVILSYHVLHSVGWLHNTCGQRSVAQAHAMYPNGSQPWSSHHINQLKPKRTIRKDKITTSRAFAHSVPDITAHFLPLCSVGVVELPSDRGEDGMTASFRIQVNVFSPTFSALRSASFAG